MKKNSFLMIIFYILTMIVFTKNVDASRAKCIYFDPKYSYEIEINITEQGNMTLNYSDQFYSSRPNLEKVTINDFKSGNKLFCPEYAYSNESAPAEYGTKLYFKFSNDKPSKYDYLLELEEDDIYNSEATTTKKTTTKAGNTTKIRATTAPTTPYIVKTCYYGTDMTISIYSDNSVVGSKPRYEVKIYDSAKKFSKTSCAEEIYVEAGTRNGKSYNDVYTAAKEGTSILKVHEERENPITTTSIQSTTTTPTKENMAEMLDVCESSGPLQVIYAAKIIFAFICYAVPLLIAIMLTIDISKVVTDTTQVKKVVDVAKKRILIGLLLLFTPTLVKLLINSLGSDSDLQRCYNNAEPSHIKARKEYEKEYFNGQRETKKTGKHTTRSIIGTPLNISSGWKEKTENSKGTFGNYLYVPENVTSNTPLVLILPGDNNGAEYNWSSKTMKEYFAANYGSGKTLNYSTTFILIPKLNYSSLGSDDKAHQTGDYRVALDNIFNSSSPIFDNVTLSDLKIDRSRVSIVGFSTGASYMFTYTNLHRDYFSAMYVISNGGGVSGLGSDLDYYRKMPMMGAAEGEGSRVYASNTKAIFDALGKSGYYTEAAGYTHGQMHEYVFSRDTNRDGYNDSIEWLISQGSGGGSTPTIPTGTIDTSNKCYNPFKQYVIGEPAVGTFKLASITTSTFAVPIYSSMNKPYQITSLSFHENIKIPVQNIMNNVSVYVKAHSDIIPVFQTGGAYATKGGSGTPMSYSYHTQGFAIDLFNEWCITKNNTRYCPYSGQGNGTWSNYKKLVCELCNGKEDCEYNINYQIYKYYFEGNNWCWGGNWGPDSFDPMHFEVVGQNGYGGGQLPCGTNNKQQITC